MAARREPGQHALDLWGEATLLAELAQRQETLVSEMLTRAQQHVEVERENLRLSRELADSVDRLQEVHHRIRNHLQAVSGLLSAEEVTADSESARRALRDSIARLTSIAAIHDLLARDPLSGQLHLTELLPRLSQHLLAQAGAADRVTISADITELPLGAKETTALVLILTELLSNALAHAFANRAHGQVSVSLRADADRALLCVKDNGRGLPQGFDPAHTSTLGLRLVTRLAERDLGGSISIASQDGASFVVDFPIRPEASESGTAA